jgi:hypothetical protein
VVFSNFNSTAWSLASVTVTERASSSGDFIALANWAGVLVSIYLVVGPTFRRIGSPSAVTVLLR